MQRSTEVIVREAAELAARVGRGDTTPGLTGDLAQRFIELRTHYVREDGRPDMGGRTHAYRQVVRQVYEDAGLEPGPERTRVMNAVRGVLNSRLRRFMREQMGMSDEEISAYGMDPLSNREKQRAVPTERVLPALRLPQDPPERLRAVARYVQNALQVADLPDGELPEDVLGALEDARGRLDAILARV
ncbi:MAG: hypothetical protein IRY90_19775 [Actinomadura rubrobrunea]|nr:hypothetical protein [Actinomadura rubrobrunea]